MIPLFIDTALSLKTEKEKYYNNDPTAKFKDTKSILQEELRIFTEILDDRIVIHQKKIQILETEKKPVQRKLLKVEGKEEPEQKELFEEQRKVLQQKIEDIKDVKKRLKSPITNPLYGILTLQRFLEIRAASFFRDRARRWKHVKQAGWINLDFL